MVHSKAAQRLRSLGVCCRSCRRPYSNPRATVGNGHSQARKCKSSSPQSRGRGWQAIQLRLTYSVTLWDDIQQASSKTCSDEENVVQSPSSEPSRENPTTLDGQVRGERRRSNWDEASQEKCGGERANHWQARGGGQRGQSGLEVAKCVGSEVSRAPTPQPVGTFCLWSVVQGKAGKGEQDGR